MDSFSLNMASEQATSKFAMEEIAKHKSKESLWIVVDDRVFDVTKFIHEVLFN